MKFVKAFKTLQSRTEHVDMPDLEHHVADDDKEWVGQVEQEPHLDGFDDGRAGQTAGHGEVDRGEDHHAGDVYGDDHVVLCLSSDVVGGLVNYVHQDGGEVAHHEDFHELP